MSDLATLRIVVDANGAIRTVDQLGNSLTGTSRKSELLTSAVKGLAVQLGAIVGGGAILRKFIDESSQAQAVQAQLAATLRSTGSAAGQSLDALNRHAAALQKVTTFGDDAVGSAQALLLTFTKIGGETFPQATEAVLNVAQAMQMDLKSAAVQVGKALNDPILGLTALSRSGIQFSESQKETIKTLVEFGRTADAQRIILGELETQFGGSARAARDTLGGAIKGLQNAFGDLFEMSREESGPFIAFIDGLTDAITDLGATWQLTWAEMQVASVKAIAAIDQALATSNLAIGSFLYGATGGLFGQGIINTAAGRLSQNSLDTAALDQWLDGLRQKFNDRIVGGGSITPGLGPTPGGIGSGGVPTLGSLGANRQGFGASGFPGFPGYDPNGLRNAANIQGERARQQQAIEAEQFARTFYEQMQIGMGRFFSDFFQHGLKSLPDFWNSFKSLAFDALGQLAGKSVMDALGSRLPGAFGGGLGGTLAAGVGFGVLAGVVDSLLDGGKAARQMAQAMEESARSIERYGRFATDMGLTSEQRQLRDLLDQRDALARQAVGAAGVSGFSGGLADAITLAQTFLEMTGSGRYQTLLDQLNALQDAYDGNVEAVRANVEALKAQAEAERAAAYNRQIAGLQSFADSLKLGSQSTLSPTAMLAEARRQYEAILALAQAGDQSAIASLPETARAFLDASRRVNASGTRYAADFNRVQADTTAVIAAIETMRDETPVWVGEFLERVDPYYTEQIDIATTTLTVQQEGFTRVVERLDTVALKLDEVRTAIGFSVAIGDDPVLF